MHKKIGRFTISMGLFYLFGVTSGMNRDVAMSELVRKEIIPILALNNYVVNASSAYQALYKEAHLFDASLKNMKDRAHRKVKQVNNNYRSCLKKNGSSVYTVDVSMVRKQGMNPVRDFQFSRIDIVYQHGSKNQCNVMSAYMKRNTSEYYAFQSRLRYRQCPVVERFIKNIGPLLKNKLGSLLKQGEELYIELYSHNNLSDWIRVINLSDSVERTNTPRSSVLLLKNSPLLREEESSLFHSRDLDYNSLDRAGIRFCSSTLIFSATVLASVLLGLSFYGS